MQKVDHHHGYGLTPAVDDLYWCAVKGASPSELVARLFPSGSRLRTSSERPVGRCTGAVVIGDWTFIAAPADFHAETKIVDREVLILTVDGRNQWASIACRLGAATRWVVHGAAEADCVYADGMLPDRIDDLVDAVVDCEEVPILVGERLTGFRHDREPDHWQVVDVAPARDLRLPGKVIEQAPWDQVKAALDHVLATKTAWLAIAIEKHDVPHTLRARHAFDGSLTLELDGVTRRLDTTEFVRGVRSYFDRGELPSR